MSRTYEREEGAGTGKPSRSCFHRFYRDLLSCRRGGEEGMEAVSAGCAAALGGGDSWILAASFRGGVNLHPGIVVPSGRSVALASGCAVGLRNEGLMVMAVEAQEGLNDGLFYEGLLFAREQKLPVVVVTVVSDGVPVADAGLPAYSADGVDVLDVFRWVRQAAEEARSGEGPRIVNLRLREGGGEPVSRYRRVLQLEGLMDDSECRAIEASVGRDSNGGSA